MRMWASCRPDQRPARPTPERGFTLLEVLVVLVIISMAVAVVAPRLHTRVEIVNTL